MPPDRLTRVFELAYEALHRKINGGRIRVENEASLQLQFASLLKTLGEVFEAGRDENFSIELEKPVTSKGVAFGKSGSERAKVDIYFSYTNVVTNQTTSCAVELKFFKKKNQREPNNRYDVFTDIHNLENYGSIATQCFMVVATDHDHYITQKSYSAATSDFDLRNGKSYVAGEMLTYRTEPPYGPPMSLKGSYQFSWDTTVGGVHFLRIPIAPHR